MNREKFNSQSNQQVDGGGDLYKNEQNNNIEQYQSNSDNISTENGIFSFRNMKQNSNNPKNEIFERDYGQLSKHNLQSNHNLQQIENLLYPQGNSYNQSIEKNFISQQSLSANPAISLQTFGNQTNQRKDKESNISFLENQNTQQGNHQRPNSDFQISNNTKNSEYQQKNSELQQSGINGRYSQNNSQSRYQNQQINIPDRFSINQQQNSQQEDQKQLQNRYSINKQNHNNNGYNNFDSEGMIQNRGSNARIQGSINNNQNYESINSNQQQYNEGKQQMNRMVNNQISNGFDKEMNRNQTENQKEYQNYYQKSQIEQINIIDQSNNIISSQSNSNANSQKNYNQLINPQQNNQNQQLNTQHNKQYSFSNSQQMGQSQLKNSNYNTQNKDYNIQNSNPFNIQDSNSSSLQKSNSIQRNQNDRYSHIYQGQQDKNTSTNKNQQQQLNTGRNSSINSYNNYEYQSPRQDSYKNINQNMQSQQNSEKSTFRQKSIGYSNNNEYQIKDSNINPQEQQQTELKDITARDSGKYNQESHKSNEDEFLQKFKKLKNNEFMNRPYSQNPDKRKQNHFFYVPPEKIQIDNNQNTLNNRSINQGDTSRQRQNLNVSNNSFNLGNTNSNNNSFLNRRGSKASEYVNYPTHSKRKMDGFNTSGRKDTSRYETSLLLTKEKDIEGQLHQIGSPFSPHGYLDNFSCKNSQRYMIDGISKTGLKNENSQGQFTTINNNSSSFQNNNFQSKNVTNFHKTQITQNNDSMQQFPQYSGRTHIDKNNNNNNQFTSNKIQQDCITYSALVPSDVSQQDILGGQNLTPSQRNIQNQDKSITNRQVQVIQHPHKDQFGRSQSAGIILKKQKIFADQPKGNLVFNESQQKINLTLNENKSLLIQNQIQTKTPQNQFNDQTFQFDQEKNLKNQIFNDNSFEMKTGRNQLHRNISQNEIKKFQNTQFEDSDKGISKTDEENLKKYIQLQQKTNTQSNQQTIQNINDNKNSNLQNNINKVNYQSTDVLKNNNRNLSNNKLQRGNTKEEVPSSKGKSPKHQINNGYFLTKNQEKSLKKTAAEYLMQKAGKQKEQRYNISGQTPISIQKSYSNIHQKDQINMNINPQNINNNSNINNNYQNLKYNITTTLQTTHDYQGKLTKYSDNFIKKKSLPTQQNTQEDNVPLNFYLKKNTSNKTILNRNNEDDKQQNNERSKTPRIKIFEHEHPNNRSFNKIDKSRERSQPPAYIADQSFRNKSPFMKDLDTKNEAIINNNVMNIKSSPINQKIPNYQVNRYQVTKQYIDHKENLLTCDNEDYIYKLNNKAKTPLEIRHDLTQTYFNNVKRENKYDGVQQLQNTDQKNNFQDIQIKQIQEKQFQQQPQIEQLKKVINKDNENQNKITYNVNQKKMSMGNNILTTQEQDAYLDIKYGRNNSLNNILVFATPRAQVEAQNTQNQTNLQFNQTGRSSQQNSYSNRTNLSEQQSFYYCKLCQIFTRDTSQQHEILCKKQLTQIDSLPKTEQILFINSRLNNIYEFHQIVANKITTKKIIFYSEFHEESIKEIIQNNSNVEKMQADCSDAKLLYERTLSFLQQYQSQNSQTSLSLEQNNLNKELLQLIEITVQQAFLKLKAVSM